METVQQFPRPGQLKDISSVSKHVFRPDISTKDSQKMYDIWASSGTYDEVNFKAQYFNAYDRMMEAVLQYFPHRRDINILDVGAGTGIIGQRLKAEGFSHVDGLEPSKEMMKTARERKAYDKYLSCFITKDPTDCIGKDTYDLLLMCGVHVPGGLTVDVFTEVLRIGKPGAYIIICMRAEYMETCPEYRTNWQPFVSALIRDGKMALVDELRYPSHFEKYDGLRLVYRVL